MNGGTDRKSHNAVSIDVVKPAQQVCLDSLD